MHLRQNAVINRLQPFSVNVQLIHDDQQPFFFKTDRLATINQPHAFAKSFVSAPLNGTAEYLAQAKEYSQKLIDAVQSKGLYNIASREIGENYQKLLYRHLLLVAALDDADNAQRTAALEAVSSSADNVPLSMYLDSLPGVKNKAVSHLYKLRQWKMLLALLKK